MAFSENLNQILNEIKRTLKTRFQNQHNSAPFSRFLVSVLFQMMIFDHFQCRNGMPNDPYCPIEELVENTRQALKLLQYYQFKVRKV